MSAVLDAIAAGEIAVVGLVASLPGLTYRAAQVPYTSRGGGHFDDMVLSWGIITYAISDRNGSLPGVETRVRVADPNRVLHAIYEGSGSDSVRGSAAAIYLMTPGQAYDAEPLFVGQVVKFSFPSMFEVEITLRTNDDQILRMSPRGGWAITRVSWPHAKAEVFDKMAPLLYGIHDASYSRTGPGMVPCLLGDTLLHIYIVCAGVAKSIIRVYVNGAQVSNTTYTVSTVTRSGREYTCITFTSSIPAEADDVTCDAQGYESDGDGSGTVITNPATQWAHRLSNFVLGDYMAGSWLSTNALIDSTLLTAAEAHFTALGASGSAYHDTKQTGKAITAQYCKSFGMRCFWTRAGKVAMSYENIFAAPYQGTRWEWHIKERGEFSFIEDDYQVTSRLLVRQTPSASDGTFLSTIEFMDASIDNETQDSLDLEMSEAR